MSESNINQTVDKSMIHDGINLEVKIYNKTKILKILFEAMYRKQ